MAAAPHVRFDGWSEHFTRITAENFGVGRVVARHFRDDNEFDIPVSIGRHIHVNRPTESRHRRGREIETARAREAYGSYVAALSTAGGSGLPLKLLIEFHGHRRHDAIEIATTGISSRLAAELKQAASIKEGGPRLIIEPLDKVHYRASRAKQSGSLLPDVCRQALHIELPRGLRSPAGQRQQTWALLRPLLDRLLKELPD